MKNCFNFTNNEKQSANSLHDPQVSNKNYRSGQDNINLLQLEVIIDLSVTRQLLTLQTKRLKFIFPVLAALAAQGFDWRHYNTKRLVKNTV